MCLMCHHLQQKGPPKLCILKSVQLLRYHSGECSEMMQPIISITQRQSSIGRAAVCLPATGSSSELSRQTYWSLSVSSMNAAANLALWVYEHPVSADIQGSDLSLSLFISCLACNHPVSAQAAAWLVQCRSTALAWQKQICRPPHPKW